MFDDLLHKNYFEGAKLEGAGERMGTKLLVRTYVFIA